MTAWKIFLIVCTVMFVAISVSAVFPVFAKIMTPAPVSPSVAGTQRQSMSGAQQSPAQPSESPRRPASQTNSGAYISAG